MQRAWSPDGRGSAKLQAAEFQRRSPSPTLSSHSSSSSSSADAADAWGGMRKGQTSLAKRFWLANRPALLVALAQLFGALMNLSARLLGLQGPGMSPVQMLLVRQGATCLCCVAYMWWKGIPHFPYGQRGIRGLLVARGCAGCCGILGLWWSMMYLPLADATVITFLAPGVAGFLCYFLLDEPFTRLDQAATLVALAGVVLIAQPAALFTGASSSAEGGHGSTAGDAGSPHGSVPGAHGDATPQERLFAVGVALIGVFGAAGAFATLRAIGKRAHPLISVNAFAAIGTVMSISALALGTVLDIGQPSLRWMRPASPRQWLLLLSLGAAGFVNQYLLAAGLAADKSNRANAMVYTHMVFAASFDRWIFGHRMGLASLAGCTLILGSALGVVLMKKRPPRTTKAEDVGRRSDRDGVADSSPMLVVGEAGHADDVSLREFR
ncbi:hypothetical protein UVI_02000900 [Ustilaginoidea virens]|uniref:EamA domain-containing protein n=1 Tax=Ustilaginoidea virens TaxID=1159556 RepID=A0A1B5L4W1_USTVR|nr:hypothetical protein UVI_02000900 [Ustilaginoidea virens]